ncbi:hypothetical protein F5Y16DRAFT_292732 [Xylariaceae sp. FL0255]|nr:hypothetical protein F5Y16DRAFT_292732 [Xylariaceae sp. FL0255]
MQFHQIFATLAGLLSLVEPAHSFYVRDVPSADRPTPKWKPKKRGGGITIQQIVQETTIIVEENQGEIDALTQLAEQEFAQLVEAEVALVTQLQDVKNNIRLNHFRARFSQANTVIVVVTTLVDARANKNNAKRYMVQQLEASAAPTATSAQDVTVMVSDAQTMTIGSAATGTFGVGGGVLQASAASAPPVSPSQLAVADPSAPFGSVNQSLILPIGASAPSVDIVFEDPATIILPNQNNLFVESTNTFLSDCVFYEANSDAFVDIAGEIFTSFAVDSSALAEKAKNGTSS